MTPQDFYSRHHAHVQKHARFLMKAFRLPQHMYEDLIGAGYVAICTSIGMYDELKGTQVTTYLFKTIRREMLCEIRGSMHIKRHSRHKMNEYIRLLEPDEQVREEVMCSLSIEEKLDLHNLVQRQLRANHRTTSDMLVMAFDRYVGSEMAAASGVTRQSFGLRVKAMKNKMKRSMRVREGIDRKFA